MKRAKIIVLILEVALFLALIWLFSSQERSTSANLSSSVSKWLLEHFYPGFTDLSKKAQNAQARAFNRTLRKCAHFIEFAMLGQALLNLWNILRTQTNKRLNIFISLICAFLVAVGDEAHQIFVSGRGPQVSDVLIDTSGAFFGILCTYLILSKIHNCHVAAHRQ